MYKANQQPGDKSGEGDAEGVAYSKKAKQGGRSSQNSEVTEANQTQGGKKTKSAKRGLQAGADQAGKENTENTEKPRRKNHGRISLNEETAPTEIQKPRRRKKDKQLAVAVIEEAEPESGVEQESRPRTKQKRAARASNQARQRRTSDEQAGSRSSSPEPAPYRHLVNHTRHITRHTIQETWSPLDSACVDSVANILHVASRPVLLRLNNLTKHAQATSALNAISNRLRSKLTRGLPFPPATTSNRREDELDFEYTVDGTEILEAQLDPLLHSVALLQREKERAEQELGRDYKILNSLSINAKSEMRGRKEQLRKVHLLVPDTRSDGNSPDSRRLGNLEVSETVTSKTFSMLEGDDLQGLAGQLGNHMESMRGNLQQIEGVIPAITDSRAALRHALLSHLSQDAFDQVILG